ncbi:MAG: cell wall metabolism sensor histidine kinase WalK [Oscillospiraceae bacterium]|nr:cell wall metabolism sensor histidine kinase WalK [Oscillospiraceae bacterium]
MIRSVQIKIIIIFMVLGVACIFGLGVFFISGQQATLSEIGNSNTQAVQSIQNQIEKTKIIVIYSVAIFCIISLVVGYFVTKAIIRPISELIKNTEKIVAGEDVEIKYLVDEKGNTEISDLTEVFSKMTEELKEKLNETATQKRQIETILLKMSDGVIAFDIRGHILHINEAAIELLGVKDIQDNFKDIFGKLKLELDIEKIMYLENMASYDQRVSINDKYLNMFFASFKDEENRPEGVIVVIQDITEHVKLDNMRKEFVANVSHELKTPITSIIGYSETLQVDDYEKDMQNKFLGVIVSEAARMSKMVNELLILSKYDNDEIVVEKTEFDLGELTKSVYEKLMLEAKKKNQSLECFVTASVPNVIADRYGIERVIINILSNSIKYTRRKWSCEDLCRICI